MERILKWCVKYTEFDSETVKVAGWFDKLTHAKIAARQLKDKCICEHSWILLLIPPKDVKD